MTKRKASEVEEELSLSNHSEHKIHLSKVKTAE